jgi:hypothetical protein
MDFVCTYFSELKNGVQLYDGDGQAAAKSTVG